MERKETNRGYRDRLSVNNTNHGKSVNRSSAGKGLRTRQLCSQVVSISTYSAIKSSNDVIERFNKLR
ncbi:hypothetical protein CWO01_01950 [Vibrio splendidus]|nr:hypothetical protein CWO01_01950 [Vibrio splendidus]